LSHRIFGQDSDPYNCHANQQKAELIAENMIQDWRFAKKLVESYGGTFVATLQPVSYFSRTQLNHLKLAQEFAPEFKVVYPIMRKEMAASGKEYDLTSVFGVDDEV